MRQLVPRWLSTDKAVIDAYVALVDKACPCVLLRTARAARSGCKSRSSGRTNSHMLTQDKNSAEIAEVIQRWLAGKGLVE